MRNQRYTLEENTNIKLDVSPKRLCSNNWLTVTREGLVLVTKGYKWDGCSPSISVGDLFWVGTPEGVLSPEHGKPKTYYASLFHDALIKFQPEHGLSRKQIDQVFYQVLKQDEFKLARLYYVAVRAFSLIRRKR